MVYEIFFNTGWFKFKMFNGPLWASYGVDCCGAAYPLQEGKCPPALRFSFHLPVCLSAYLHICLPSSHLPRAPASCWSLDHYILFIVCMVAGFISQWLEFLLLLPPLLGWSGTELVRTAENFLSTELARYPGCCVLGWVMIGRNFRGRSAWVGAVRIC